MLLIEHVVDVAAAHIMDGDLVDEHVVVVLVDAHEVVAESHEVVA